MESQGAAYDGRLRDGFLAEAARDPAHIVVINAARSIDEVQADVRAAAERVFAVK
jgi:thymidylate kinase